MILKTWLPIAAVSASAQWPMEHAKSVFPKLSVLHTVSFTRGQKLAKKITRKS